MKRTSDNGGYRICVYTALSGPKSRLQPSQWVRPDIDYVCFTDQQQAFPAPWQIRPLVDFPGLPGAHPDPCRNAKRYKILPHIVLPEYHTTVWIDANMRVTRGFDELIADLNLGERAPQITAFKHFERDCLYDEGEVCKAMGLDQPEIINRQMARYREQFFPAHYGLTECGVLVRYNTPDIKTLMEFWWEEIEKGSRRDQLSFMYSVWRLRLRHRLMIQQRTGRDGTYHDWTAHLNMSPL